MAAAQAWWADGETVQRVQFWRWSSSVMRRWSERRGIFRTIGRLRAGFRYDAGPPSTHNCSARQLLLRPCAHRQSKYPLEYRLLLFPLLVDAIHGSSSRLTFPEQWALSIGSRALRRIHDSLHGHNKISELHSLTLFLHLIFSPKEQPYLFPTPQSPVSCILVRTHR